MIRNELEKRIDDLQKEMAESNAFLDAKKQEIEAYNVKLMNSERMQEQLQQQVDDKSNIVSNSGSQSVEKKEESVQTEKEIDNAPSPSKVSFPLSPADVILDFIPKEKRKASTTGYLCIVSQYMC